MPYKIDDKAKKDIETSILMSDFAKTNRVLSGQEVYVSTLTTTNHIASTHKIDGKFYIQFSEYDLPLVYDADSLVPMFGLNYHELSHVLFTYDGDRNEKVTRLMARNKRNSVHRHVWNILEDLRIENMFTRRHRNTQAYFQALISKTIVTQIPHENAKNYDAVVAGVYFLLSRRDYMKASLKAAARKSAVKVYGKQVVDQIDQITSEYVDAGTNLSVERTDELVDAYVKLMFGSVDYATGLSVAEATGGNHTPEADDMDIHKESKKDGQKNDGEQGEDDGEGDGEGTGDSGDNQAGGESGEADGQEAGEDGGEGAASDEADDDGDGNGSSSDADVPDGEAVDAESEGGGTGAGTTKASDDAKSVQDELKDAIEDSKADSFAKQDVERVSVAMRSLRNENYTKLPRSVQPSGQIDPSMSVTAKNVSRSWQKVIEDRDPGRLTHQSSGTVNMNRVIRGGDLDTIFDVWDEGQSDTASLEVVAGIDVSGSMDQAVRGTSYNKLATARRATWILHRSANLASREIAWSNIMFNTVASYLEERNAPAPKDKYRLFGAHGGTDPTQMLQEANAIFATSKRKKKLLIIITDGIWVGSSACNDMLRSMEANGVVTSLVYLPMTDTNSVREDVDAMYSGVFTDDKINQDVLHGVHHATVVKSDKALVDFASGVVKRVMTSKG